tara:strand:- start:141 stop:599 length:459 start_codon:yes stop_codon:yes gene_type:complete
MPVDAKEWTLSGLSVELRMDHRGLSKKIEDVKPCRENKRSKFYRMADVVRALVDGNKAAQPFEESRARKMAADADLAEIKAAQAARDVIEVETVLRVWEQVVVALRQKVMHAESLDESERREMLEDLQKIEIDEYFETGTSVEDGQGDAESA